MEVLFIKNKLHEFALYMVPITKKRNFASAQSYYLTWTSETVIQKSLDW
jgi:hypothetical protein